MNNKSPHSAEHIDRARCLEHPLTVDQARDFTKSAEVAAGLLREAHAALIERDRTLVLTAPGGRMLAYIRGDRAWFTTPIDLSVEDEPEFEIVDELDTEGGGDGQHH